jgi:hypothetical protein
MSSELVTVPTDVVTLHRWDPVTGELGEQIGDPVPVSGPGVIQFPAYVGDPTAVCVACWYEGRLLFQYELREYPSGRPPRPTQVTDGDIVSIELPITATLSPS